MKKEESCLMIMDGSVSGRFWWGKKKTVDGLGAPYTFLGMVNYKSHEGSNPMNIIWELV